MTDGKYHTTAGSEVTIRHGRLAEWSFDWFEEDHACCECVPYAVDEQDGQPYLVWACNDCPGGSALLLPGEAE